MNCTSAEMCLITRKINPLSVPEHTLTIALAWLHAICKFLLMVKELLCREMAPPESAAVLFLNRMYAKMWVLCMPGAKLFPP
jgi:hypothetical protein